MYRRPRSGQDATANAVGSLSGALFKKAKETGNKSNQEELDRNRKTMEGSIRMAQAIDAQTRSRDAQLAEEREDVEFIKGNRQGAEGYPDMPNANWGSTNDSVHPLKLQMQNQKVAEEAKYSPVNGQYTEQGREHMVNEVQNNVHDIELSKMLMYGMGGSIKPVF